MTVPSPWAGVRHGASSEKLARIGLLVCVLLVAIVLFEPHPTIASNVVRWLTDLLLDLGAAPTLVTGSRMEAVLNAGMFVPPAALAMLAFGRLRWSDVVAVSFTASLGVEMFQGLFLAARSAQAIDVVANTTGALAGGLIANALCHRAAAVQETQS